MLLQDVIHDGTMWSHRPLKPEFEKVQGFSAFSETFIIVNGHSFGCCSGLWSLSWTDTFCCSWSVSWGYAESAAHLQQWLLAEWSCIITPIPVTALICLSCSLGDQRCCGHSKHHTSPCMELENFLWLSWGKCAAASIPHGCLVSLGLSDCFFRNFWCTDLSFFVVSIVGVRIYWNNFSMWLWKPLTPADLLIFSESMPQSIRLSLKKSPSLNFVLPVLSL